MDTGNHANKRGEMGTPYSKKSKVNFLIMFNTGVENGWDLHSGSGSMIASDHQDEMPTDELELAFHTVLSSIEENVYREGIVKTPQRAAKAMQFLTQGYQQDAAAILRSAMFKED